MKVHLFQGHAMSQYALKSTEKSIHPFTTHATTVKKSATCSNQISLI